MNGSIGNGFISYCSRDTKMTNFVRPETIDGVAESCGFAVLCLNNGEKIETADKPFAIMERIRSVSAANKPFARTRQPDDIETVDGHRVSIVAGPTTGFFMNVPEVQSTHYQNEIPTLALVSTNNQGGESCNYIQYRDGTKTSASRFVLSVWKNGMVEVQVITGSLADRNEQIRIMSFDEFVRIIQDSPVSKT